MGGRAGSPLYAIPVIRNLMAASFSQPGSPAMLADLSAHTGTRTAGLKGSTAPFSHCSLIGSPFSLSGVWQSAHIPMFCTRYFPRAIVAGDAERVLSFWSAKIGTHSNASVIQTKITFFINKLLEGFLGGIFGG